MANKEIELKQMALSTDKVLYEAKKAGNFMISPVIPRLRQFSGLFELRIRTQAEHPFANVEVQIEVQRN